MKNKSINKIVFTSIFMAMIFVSTYVIRIPSTTGGYVNLGDAFVLVSGWLLGPFSGALSSGIGSMLTDFLSGYSLYAPATLVIKAVVSLVSAFIYKAMKNKTIGMIIGGIAGELIMTVSYFGFSYILLGNGISAALNIPADIVQGAVGIIVGIIIMKILKRTKLDVIIKGEN